MKEYVLSPIPQNVQNQVAFGGILGSVVALSAALFWFNRKPDSFRSAMLAGTMAGPGFYLLRFALAGRGHDGTEFQEAQAAVGLPYAGHAVDWLFVGLFVLTAVFWFWRSGQSLTLRLTARLIIGSLLALAVLVLLQTANNAIFDPLFAPPG